MVFNELLIVICVTDTVSLLYSLRWNAREELFPLTLQAFHYYIQGDFPQGKDLEDCRKPRKQKPANCNTSTIMKNSNSSSFTLSEHNLTLMTEKYSQTLVAQMAQRANCWILDALITWTLLRT